MKKALVLFTGINFSHEMAERAFDWAVQNKASVQIIFLKASREKEEGYGFPSDLDAAEKLTTRREAEEDDLKLIKDYQKILDDLGREKKVPVSIEILTDPPLEKVYLYTRDTSIVYVDASYDPSDPLSPQDFSIEAMKENSLAPVEVVSDFGRE